MLIARKINQDFSSKVMFMDENGVLMVEAVEFACTPIRCFHYNVFVHSIKKCKKNRMSWRRKVITDIVQQSQV